MSEVIKDGHVENPSDKVAFNSLLESRLRMAALLTTLAVTGVSSFACESFVVPQKKETMTMGGYTAGKFNTYNTYFPDKNDDQHTATLFLNFGIENDPTATRRIEYTCHLRKSCFDIIKRLNNSDQELRNNKLIYCIDWNKECIKK